MTIDDIIDTFDILGDWEERYRFIIELGGKLAPMDPGTKIEDNLVEGCVSNVWLVSECDGATPRALTFKADSDAFIVRGLASLLLTVYSGKTPAEILAVDAQALFRRLGLDAHLSPTRANGLLAMVENIRRIARAAA